MYFAFLIGFLREDLQKYYSINKVLYFFNLHLEYTVYIIKVIVLILEANKLITTTDRILIKLDHYQGRILTISLIVEV